MDLAKHGLTDLQSYIDYLDEANLLVRVKSAVDSDRELAGIAKKFEAGKAVLFENVKDRDYPVLVGLYWNRSTTSRMFGTTSERLPFVLSDEMTAGRGNPI